jgi:hypothetical protein
MPLERHRCARCAQLNRQTPMKRRANFPALIYLLVVPATSWPQVIGKLPEAPNSTIGYESVAAARKALQAKPDIEQRTENGWLILIDDASRTVWSFAPRGHAAYPTAVKRTTVAAKVGSTINTTILCESDKASCDTVVLQFEELTDRALRNAQ